jgi:uncharacterized protein YjbJ (UPF0337 family)
LWEVDLMSADSKNTVGRVKEVLGAVTGDRRVEAKGRAEEKAADAEDPGDDVTDELVAREEDAVRKRHGDT